MNMNVFKWVSVALLVLVLVASLFFPVLVVSLGFFGAQGLNFFQTFEIGWFYAILAVIFELALIGTVFFALIGQIKNGVNSALNSGVLVIAATVLLTLFYLFSGLAASSLVDVGVSAWPFVNILFAVGAFVCRTMYVHGTAKISLGDVRAAATDVRNLSVNDCKNAAASAVGGVRAAASDALGEMGLTWKCPSCGRDVSSKANFCPECGAKKPE